MWVGKSLPVLEQKNHNRDKPLQRDWMPSSALNTQKAGISCQLSPERYRWDKHCSLQGTSGRYSKKLGSVQRCPQLEVTGQYCSFQNKLFQNYTGQQQV